MTAGGVTGSENAVVRELLRAAQEFLAHEHSLFRSLGLSPILIGRGKTSFAMDLPPEFGGGDGDVHEGLHAIILDSIMGLTVLTALETFKPIATVNLRTDHIARAASGARVVCACECVALVDEIAYVAGRLAEEISGRVLSTGGGAFMVGTKGPVKGSRL
jgi:acyl-coenzyme A thioesterase PaaI-like protein